jgi:hypothetical protein
MCGAQRATRRAAAQRGLCHTAPPAASLALAPSLLAPRDTLDDAGLSSAVAGTGARRAKRQVVKVRALRAVARAPGGCLPVVRWGAWAPPRRAHACARVATESSASGMWMRWTSRAAALTERQQARRARAGRQARAGRTQGGHGGCVALCALLQSACATVCACVRGSWQLQCVRRKWYTQAVRYITRVTRATSDS